MSQKLIIILILAILVPDTYIYKMFVARPEISPSLKVAFFIPTLLLTGGLVYLLWAGRGSSNPQLFGWFMMLYFFLTLPKLIFFIFSVIGLPFTYIGVSATPFHFVGILLGACVAVIIAYGTLIGKTRFDVKKVEYRSAKLPQRFDGYKIVLLADIHTGSWRYNKRDMERAVELVNEQKADIILFAGDLVNNQAIELDGFEEILAGMEAKEGVYSVMGNHDYGPYYRWKNKREEIENIQDVQRREARMGWKLLNNESQILYCKGDSIALIGVENDGEPPFSQYADLPKALTGTDGLFKILMSHNPTHWHREVLPDSDIDLMVAGHTHAMQIALGRYSPSSLVYPEWGGIYY